MGARDFVVQPLLPEDAEVIARWRYEGQYAFYDAPAGLEPETAAYLLEPRSGFHAVRGAEGLVGFCSFGDDARVPGGAYEGAALDVGAGMDPRLVGAGRGAAFLEAIVRYAVVQKGAGRLRVTIASWNERALSAARGVGFRPTSTFRSDRGQDFTILVRPEER